MAPVPGRVRAGLRMPDGSPREAGPPAGGGDDGGGDVGGGWAAPVEAEGAEGGTGDHG